jgi:hypothetical protein
MKLCRTCNTEKNEGDFGKRSASVDGLAAKCKSCQSEYDKRRAMLPHRVDARAKYLKTESGKEAHNRAAKKWSDNNALKRAAHIILGNALRDGKIFKLNACEICDSEDNIHGHHDDYSQPLGVTWLCAKCHKDWHKRNKARPF